MRKRSTVLVGFASAALIATGGTMTASAASTAPASGKSDAQQPAAADVSAAKYSCTRGAVCFYTKANGKGKRHQVFSKTNRNFKHLNSAYNNGKSGLNHARVKWHYKGGKDHWGCLDPKEKWSTGKTEWVVDAVRWKSKC